MKVGGGNFRVGGEKFKVNGGKFKLEDGRFDFFTESQRQMSRLMVEKSEVRAEAKI